MCGGYGVGGGRACCESIVIGSARGSTSSVPACTSGTSAQRCCSGSPSEGSSTGSTTTSSRSRRSAPGSGSSRRTGATSSPLSATARPGDSACIERVHPLRAVRRADPLPKVAAVTAGLAGLVNLASAVTPNIAWRNHLLLYVEPFETLKLSHAAAIPASMLLLVTSPYLWGRRQGALRLALVLLLGLTALDLLKGLDLEAAAGSAGAAGVLWLGRRSFCVRHDPDTLRQALRRVPFLAASSLLLCALAVGIAAPESAGLVTILRATGDALLWQVGPLDFHDELGHLDEAIGVAGLITLTWCAYLLFRPLAAPRVFPGVELRRAARELVRRHGDDTLAYFKLRRDQHYLFSPDRRAFLGYRVEAGRAPRLGRPRRPRAGNPVAVARAQPLRRGARPANRGARRGREHAPALEAARAPVDVPGRRGGRGDRVVLARGPADPQGPAVGHAPREAGLHGRASPARRALRRRAGRARGGEPELAPRVNPSAASRCHSTSSGARTTPTASWFWAGTRTGTFAASCTSPRATDAPPSRSR